MDFNQIIKFLAEAYPAFVPTLIVIIFFFVIGSFKKEAIDNKIDLISFQEFIQKLAIQFLSTAVSTSKDDTSQSVLKIVDFMENQRNSWKLNIYIKQRKYLNRIDYIINQQFLFVILFTATLFSVILYVADVPKDMCYLISVLTFIVAAYVYFMFRNWYYDIKKCLNA